MTILDLDANSIKHSVDLRQMLAAMRAAFVAASAGQVWVPLRGRWGFERPMTTILVMPASSEKLQISIVKTLTIVPSNSAIGMPTIKGEIIAVDRTNGTLIARLDAEAVTELRTAACSAVATDYLAPPDAEVLALFGTGRQARAHATAICTVRPIKKILIFGRDPSRAGEIARELTDATRVIASIETDLAELRSADIICTTTNAEAPLFTAEQVGARCHINAIGSYTPAMRELPHVLLRKANVFVDNVEFCAAESGELADAFGSPAEIAAHVNSIGDAISESLPPGTGVTVYKSVGNAGQDLFATALVLERNGFKLADSQFLAS